MTEVNLDIIAKRYSSVRARIETARTKTSRCDAVNLLAVSKKQPLEKIIALYKLGQRDFGESYVQEALQKIDLLKDYSIVWHFIGPLQTNKTRAVAENFQWVHSVDRFKIAQRLSAQRPESLPPLNICLQVNINNEAQKSGFAPHELAMEAVRISNLPNLVVRGLMAIPEHTDDIARQRVNFRKLADLNQAVSTSLNVQLDTLSMGMSGDLESAVLEGATIVRIGTDLFGAREY